MSVPPLLRTNVVLFVRYVLATCFWRPKQALLDEYFSAFPDAYNMQRNGPARFDALAGAIRDHVGEVNSILDVSCYEGFVLQHLARSAGAPRVAGLDISRTVIERARKRCDGLDAEFASFDLTALYRDPSLKLPVEGPFDVVLVCDILFYVGPQARRLWLHAEPRIDRKLALLDAFCRHARKAVIVQHFGRHFREPIGEVVRRAGGRELDAEWGIFLLPGSAPEA
jgi:SAM-dependent methyltransferase